MYRNVMRDRFNPGTDLTAYAQDTITGKTLVSYAGPMKQGNIAVATAAAGAAVAGVAKYDADAEELVGVARGSGRVVTIHAATSLTAGDPVEVADGGGVTTTSTGTTIGWAADNADAGADALISLAN